MNEKSIFLRSDDFDENKLSHCDLLLAFSNDHFSYAIVDSSEKCIKALYDQQYVGDVAAALSTAPALTYNFKRVKVLAVVDNELLVPVEFLTEDNAEWVEQYFNDSTDATISINKETFGFKPVVSVPNNLDILLNARFPQHQLYHPVLPMIKLVKEDGLYLNFTASSVYFMLIKEEALSYQNNFSATTAEEFNYFLLLVIETLKLERDVKIAVSGIVNPADPRFAILEKYFSSVRLNLPANVRAEDEVLSQLPAHYFSVLLALNLCE